MTNQATEETTTATATPITIDSLIVEAYHTAKDKGWHDPGMEKSVGDDIALMHSELSEALEDFRNGKGVKEVYFECQCIEDNEQCGTDIVSRTLSTKELLGRKFKGMPKPCGLPTELADVLIRIGDFCGKHGIDLESAVRAKLAYNKSRPHRHGGKKL